MNKFNKLILITLFFSVTSALNAAMDSYLKVNPDRSSALLSNSELVLRYLTHIQDNFSNEKQLVPAMEDNSGQTFNNAVTAMAFILTGQKERAERILDFYASRTDSANQKLNRQNFFFNDEARGFFQNVTLTQPYDPVICDRWMGDNAWLLLAYKYYEKEYGFTGRESYSVTAAYLTRLLMEFYIDDPGGHGGFVRHGWRWGPRNSSQPVNDYQLHEYDSSGKPVGHEEGNIDAYAALKLCGENETAAKIKIWIDHRMSELEKIPGISLPLDLYSWRSMAFIKEGEYYRNLVNIPEGDPGFIKEITFFGKWVTGFFSFSNKDINNIWLDGLGHMTCAFYAAGNSERAGFYSAQLDSFLIRRYVGGSLSLALPYTANKTGGYDWVDVSKGFSSACAWYLFAKHAFNPFTLEKNLTSGLGHENDLNINYKLEQNYPNPFNSTTRIRYVLPHQQRVDVIIYDILGNKIKELFSGTGEKGKNEVVWNGRDLNNRYVSSGVYFYKIIASEISLNGKMILQK